MIPWLRKEFNDRFTREKYQDFLRRMDETAEPTSSSGFPRRRVSSRNR
jgi:hypothetical protein